MPLLDHFHAPIFPSRPWESFHTRWANSIGDHINDLLPKRYVSEIMMHFGTQVAADLAELETLTLSDHESSNGEGAVAVQTAVAPPVTLTIPAVFPDDLRVEVVDLDAGRRLVAVVELVSPSNKDRPESRRAFAAKCAAYLQRGVGLVVADIVTSRRFNLHDELTDLLGQPASAHMPDDSFIYANGYRPVHAEAGDRIDIWANQLAVSGGLPTVPLALLGAGLILLDLEATYTDARRRARL